jgi:uncharacterized protein (TIGR03437 family)
LGTEFSASPEAAKRIVLKKPECGSNSEFANVLGALFAVGRSQATCWAVARNATVKNKPPGLVRHRESNGVFCAMRKLFFGLAMLAPLVFGQSQAVTYTYSGLPLPIYPNDWNTWSVISLFVPRSIQVTKVTVSVSVQYGGAGDLNVYLWSANGTRSKLLERNCGSLVNINTTFDDGASSRFSDACPQAGQSPFKGNEPLSNSFGENAFGYWRLGVENNGSNKTGLYTGFSITITGTPLGPPAIGPNTIMSTSSFDYGALAPGDLLTIFGTSLGPAAGVRADATQNLPTSLGGTTVMFDGAAAPIYYASDSFVQVQAPVTLSPLSATKIQAVSSSGSSNSVILPVITSRPGVFTYDAEGRGQARASNQDGSPNGDGTNLNGADKPAAAGSIISVFATGLGAVSPAVPSGNISPSTPVSTTTLPVSATIAGRDAKVTFAGLAPRQIGVYQVNVTIPLTAPSGADRLILTAGTNNSQSGVTVQVQ